MRNFSIWEAYQKAINVINSCENILQLESGYKYIRNFYKMFKDYTLDVELRMMYTKKMKEILDKKDKNQI